MAENDAITQDNGLLAQRVSDRLLYNPETGVFTWTKTRGRFAKVGDVAGYIHRSGYRRIGIDKDIFYAHRLAWLVTHGKFPVGQIDHINGVRDDNRLSNLRDVTPKINAQNIRIVGPRADRMAMGVVSDEAGTAWSAKIKFEGSVVVASGFKRMEDAHAMYLALKRRLHDGFSG